MHICTFVFNNRSILILKVQKFAETIMEPEYSGTLFMHIYILFPNSVQSFGNYVQRLQTVYYYTVYYFDTNSECKKEPKLPENY